MTEIQFHELGAIEDDLLAFAVIVSRYHGKWVYCKHKRRDTWEIPGGHIEAGETPVEAAHRELREETGAAEYTLAPVCLYAVKREGRPNNYGLLCYAEIARLTGLPDSEIERIEFFENEPEALTYPDIQPELFRTIQEKRIP